MLIESYTLKTGTFDQIGTDINRSLINNWVGPKITYNLNSQGYRCKEWDQYEWNDSILVFGASNIFGVGVCENQTMSSYIQQHTDISTINLGQIGSGCSAQWINSLRILENNITPRGVVYVWPDENRETEFKDDDGIKVDFSGHWTKRTFNSVWCRHQYQGTVLAQYYRDAIKLLWSCPVVEYRLQSNDPDSPLNQIDISRDRLHPGPETYKLWAELAVKELSLQM